MIDKINLTKRLRRFALAKYGSINALAKALGTQGGSLRSNYLSGKSVPGGEMLAKLHSLGCDPTWLLTGIGPAPDMDEPEMVMYIQWLGNTLQRQTDRLQLYRELKRQFE
jgi:transcriptional regulator with XRE-family HTH domain